jgi:hypothetical protein
VRPARNRRQPRPEHQLVAEHVDRVGLPRPGVTGEPTAEMEEMRKLVRVLRAGAKRLVELV